MSAVSSRRRLTFQNMQTSLADALRQTLQKSPLVLFQMARLILYGPSRLARLCRTLLGRCAAYKAGELASPAFKCKTPEKTWSNKSN